jgi:hypothetical protein
MGSDRPVRLRDFVYLDVERLKSLRAQLEGGLLSDWSDSTGSSKAASARGGLGIPGFGEVGGSGEYLWRNDSTETWTLHDFTYNETEEKMLELGRVKRLPEDFRSARLMDDVVRGDLSPVDYVLVNGRVGIADNSYMMELMKNLNDLVRITTEFAFQEKIAKATPGKERDGVLGEMNKQIAESSPGKEMVEKLLRMFELFQKDRLVIRVMPFPEQRNIRVVGPLQHALLRERLADIRFKFGSAPDAPWTLFGQIASVPPENEIRANQDLLFSNAIEGAVEVMMHALRGIEDQFRVRFPEIAVTPIAVYRD